MTTGSDAARGGFKNEVKFANLVNNNSSFRNELSRNLKHFNLINDDISKAKVLKGRSKTDVLLMLNNADKVGCSIKSAKANFNQLDRRWLENWVKILRMPDSIYKEFVKSLERKIFDSRDVFITPEQGRIVIPYLERVKLHILNEIFIRQETCLRIIVVYDENSDVWEFGNILHAIDLIAKAPINISGKGVLYFGDCVTLQRKGGDGHIDSPPKNSIRHPSNQLQFKVNPITLINSIPNFSIKPTNRKYPY